MDLIFLFCFWEEGAAKMEIYLIPTQLVLQLSLQLQFLRQRLIFYVLCFIYLMLFNDIFSSIHQPR